jgi:hypothetical protein
MRVVVVRAGLLFAALMSAPSIVRAGNVDLEGRYTIDGNMSDSAVTTGRGGASFHDQAQTGTQSPPFTLDNDKTLGDQVGHVQAEAHGGYHGAGLRFGVVADASAFAQFTDGADSTHPPVAGAMSVASLTFFDFVTFKTKSPGRHVRINASMNLNASLTASPEGQFKPTNGPYINAFSQAYLKFSGTGIPPGPYPDHGATTYGFAEHDIDSFSTIPTNVQEDPPKVIPVTFVTATDPVSGEGVLIDWTMEVGAASSTLNRDFESHNNGSAISIANAAHTLSWGGISSVVFADTGEPVDDWTVTSASGFDYVHAAVPEPGSLAEAVCAGAIAALVAAVGKRRASHRLGCT